MNTQKLLMKDFFCNLTLYLYSFNNQDFEEHQNVLNLKKKSTLKNILYNIILKN